MKRRYASILLIVPVSYLSPRQLYKLILWGVVDVLSISIEYIINYPRNDYIKFPLTFCNSIEESLLELLSKWENYLSSCATLNSCISNWSIAEKMLCIEKTILWEIETRVALLVSLYLWFTLRQIWRHPSTQLVPRTMFSNGERKWRISMCEGVYCV